MCKSGSIGDEEKTPVRPVYEAHGPFLGPNL